MWNRILIIGLIFGCMAQINAQEPDNIFKAAGTPANPKVNISWNRYYDHSGVTAILEKIAEAYPELTRLESMGKSYKGRDLWVLTVTNFETGSPEDKPAFYVDGNIHSNEIQGTEICMYTAWYLTESFGDNEFIKSLLTDKTFYIVPTINPDARDFYMHEANSMHSPRSGLIPLDDDRDGLINEDGYNDLNNDGHITMMRRKSAQGRYIEDPKDPRRMVMVEPDEQGTYEMLGFEGSDEDGDGQVNEDVEGFYDPNRDWAWNWQPNYIQRGAYKYPFSVPENRAVSEFVLSHPNIAGAQSYHNYGGMILRGPGAEEDKDTYNEEDARVYDAIGKKGDKMMPGYRYMVVYADLYSVFGGELDWFYGGRGIYTFTNELFTNHMLYQKDYDDRNEADADQYEFDRYMLFEDAFVPWEKYDHPQYGEIEIGGFRKNYTRANPGFLLEQDAHRNMAFTIYHAYHMPKLSVTDVKERKLGNGIREITATISNDRMIPTHSSQDVKYKIERPDYITLEGPEVVASMEVTDKDFNKTKENVFKPETVEVPNIPGMSAVTVRWLVKGNQKYNILVDSEKGGKIAYSPE